MRIPIAITALIIVSAAGLGWHNRQALASLRAEHRKLTGLATARGIFSDSAGNVRITKLSRKDGTAEAKRVAVDFIAYSMEMKSSGKNPSSPDKATRHRMIEQMDEVMSLDSDQLKVVIEEIRTAPGIDKPVRLDMLSFLLGQLVKNHPRDTLQLLTPEMLKLLGHSNGLVENHISAAIGGWAREDPAAALAWYRENHRTLSADAADSARSALISGTAATDLRLALQLTGEFGKDPAATVPSLIGRDGQTPLEKRASLGALREWLTTVADDGLRNQVMYDSLCRLVLGSGDGSAGFDSVTRWVVDAELTEAEMAIFTRRDLLDFSYYVNPEETGKWIEWLAENFPENLVSDQILNICGRWKTVSADKWFANTAAGPVKTKAILAWAETRSRYEPELAAQWAMTLPIGEDREKALGKIYQNLPAEDPERKEAFAKEHGIE
ncbi:MAG: hypothetical protein V4584_12465 [Verrucomicrobiota bacterium]